MDPDPDPNPDLTPFFRDFKDAKKKFPLFFLITYRIRRLSVLSLKILFFAKNFVSKFYIASIISVQFVQHLYEKREGSGPGSGSIPLIAIREAQNIGILIRIWIPDTS